MEGASIDDIVREMAQMPSKKDTDRLVIITQVNTFPARFGKISTDSRFLSI